jgi:selenide,water dikinase
LIGGHTMESRSTPPVPRALGVEIVITVNGIPERHLRKSRIQSGDSLLLSRPIGTGILLAGAMMGETKTIELDNMMLEINRSQDDLIDCLQKYQPEIHACTDITGFGLLGHLGEMLGNNTDLTLQLDGSAIPIYNGVLRLAEKGVASTLAPQNRSAWRLLNERVKIVKCNTELLPEILIDPQTCGPLLVACQDHVAVQLIKTKKWKKIGEAG